MPPWIKRIPCVLQDEFRSIQTFSQGVERYFLFMDMIPPIAVHIFAQNLSFSLFNIAHTFFPVLRFSFSFFTHTHRVFLLFDDTSKCTWNLNGFA
jgi:hypothetical protein